MLRFCLLLICMAKSSAMFGPPFPDSFSITLNNQTTQEFLVTPDASLGFFIVPKPGIKTSLETQSFIYKKRRVRHCMMADWHLVASFFSQECVFGLCHVLGPPRNLCKCRPVSTVQRCSQLTAVRLLEGFQFSLSS